MKEREGDCCGFGQGVATAAVGVLDCQRCASARVSLSIPPLPPGPEYVKKRFNGKIRLCMVYEIEALGKDRLRLAFLYVRKYPYWDDGIFPKNSILFR